MAPPAAPRAKASGMYANPTIPILVGENEDAFHVHYTFLEKTAFFQEHGDPVFGQTPAPSQAATPDPEQPTMSSPALSEATIVADNAEVKMEGADCDNMETETTPTFSAPQMAEIPVYRLRGLCYDPAAFEIIVNFLYNQRPATPLHRNDFKTFRKAYILALRYQMHELQDHLVGCFREFHAHYTLNFDDVTWFTNRIPGNDVVVCQVPLVQYLVDQCAFEVYREGYDEFVRRNHGFELFLSHGDRPLRNELFKAMARITRNNHPADPAVDVNRWSVHNWPHYDPKAPKAAAVDVIDIDD